jgi:hypothetical protein
VVSSIFLISLGFKSASDRDVGDLRMLTADHWVVRRRHFSGDESFSVNAGQYGGSNRNLEQPVHNENAFRDSSKL